MGAYFHQDWDLDGGSVSDTVDAFAVGAPDRVGPAMAEIDELLALEVPEGGLRDALEGMGCDYHAGDSDSDYRRWLVSIRERLAQRSST